MVAPSSLPNVASRLIDQRGAVTQEWRDFFLRLASQTDSAELRALYEELAAKVDALGGGFKIIGPFSVRVQGTPANGVVSLTLEGDVQNPGNTYYYGTGPTGKKGWAAIASAFTATVADIDLDTGPSGVTNIQLADLADSGGGTLLRINRDAKGRVAGTSTPTTDDLAEGLTNLYYTNARVIALMGDPDTDLLTIYQTARDAP